MQNHFKRKSIRYKSLVFLGFPKHKVGDDGSIWSKGKNWKCGWRKMKLGKWGRNQIVVLTYKRQEKTFSIHWLVLTAFIGPCPEGMQACHFPNKDRMDNRLSNLRWDTPKGNSGDRIYHGTDPSEERNPRAKLTREKVKIIREMYSSRQYSQSQLGRIFEVGQDTISSVVRFETWPHVR